MALISHEHGFLFVLTPRTGSTAIAHGALIPQVGAEWLPSTDLRDDAGRLLAPQKHSTVAQMRATGLLTDEQLGQLFVFAGVRNPFDSLVSLYEKIRQKYVSHFDDPDHWLHDNAGQVRWMRIAAEDGFNAWIRAKYSETRDRGPVFFQAPYTEAVDHFIRFEHLREDLAKAMVAVNIPGVEVPHLNPTSRDRDYRPYYDDWSRRRIEQVFAPTFERFGYRF